jgi:hypothetical protein
MYSYESADPVSALSFNVKGIPMSDFVYPAYFESFRKQDSARFDHLDRIRRPFQVLAGGYQQIFKHGELVDRDGPLRRARSSAMKARYDNRCEQRQRRERYRTSKKVLTRRSIPARTRKSA